MTSSSSDNPTISLRDSELVIERRWLDRDSIVPATSRAVLFNAFLAVFFYHSSSLFISPTTGTISPAIAIAAILLATGISLVYGVATAWLNRTVIVVTRTTISVRHDPLPWPGNKVISTAGIRQLHVVMSKWGRSVRRRRVFTADLIAETTDGQRTKIAGGFKQPDAVKQAIEKFLSIKPVKQAPPNAAEIDKQAIDQFLAGKPVDTPPAKAAARKA